VADYLMLVNFLKLLYLSEHFVLSLVLMRIYLCLICYSKIRCRTKKRTKKQQNASGHCTAKKAKMYKPAHAQLLAHAHAAMLDTSVPWIDRIRQSP